jgi:hypothetical protein
MESVPIGGLTLFFEAEERDASELIRHGCEKSVRLIHRDWGLETPGVGRVYVMTSWLRALSFPFWAPRAKKVWPYAGGWEQQYGQRRTVGIKPPRLMSLGDSSIGDRIFVPQDDARVKVQGVTCHELVHALSSHLRLPTCGKRSLVAIDLVKGVRLKP